MFLSCLKTKLQLKLVLYILDLFSVIACNVLGIFYEKLGDKKRYTFNHEVKTQEQPGTTKIHGLTRTNTDQHGPTEMLQNQ